MAESVSGCLAAPGTAEHPPCRPADLVQHLAIWAEIGNRCAYRIVQEGLTNVIKHAGHADAQVLVRYTGHTLGLQVIDDGPGGPAGQPTGARPAGRA